ncbi:hypothetical protein GGTG_02024 [Gaeumannomyces tritici R3-111a-1]|uniref:Uncharacterized protein n=1 Tax=Gaeumannomyces tritici (strain R3-111a-1) TaxID=644352 RepID=J3NL82_GAET3|nr:hypothetical protein GGTG_02024 [Gaeumannomyces tritici R3-111a-1]EJT82050.1 hypothetical protein GGTG_02024 [Gaeumannomyces tritici R3-111a-1]
MGARGRALARHVPVTSAGIRGGGEATGDAGGEVTGVVGKDEGRPMMWTEKGCRLMRPGLLVGLLLFWQGGTGGTQRRSVTIFISLPRRHCTFDVDLPCAGVAPYLGFVSPSPR